MSVVIPFPQIIISASSGSFYFGEWSDYNNRRLFASVGSLSQNSLSNLILNGETTISTNTNMMSNSFIPTSFTTSLWFKETATRTPGATIFSFGVPRDVGLSFSVGDIDESGSYKANINDGTTSVNGTPFSLTLNEWTHIQVSYDGSKLITYIDGILIGSVDCALIPNLRLRDKLNFSGYSGYPKFVTGEIGEFRTYSSVLTAEQAVSVYNIYGALIEKPTLVYNTAPSPVGPPIGGGGNPLYILPPSPDAVNLTTYFNNNAPQTVESAATLINAALATAQPVDVVAAVLANGSAAAFSALVNTSSLMGTSVSIPPAFAAQLYSAFENQSFNRTLPLTVNFPDAGGVSIPAPGSNSKLAIDLLSVRTTDFAVALKGSTGYGFIVKVMPGSQADVQYFVTPTNPQGTKVNVGDVLTIKTDAGETRKYMVIDLDIAVAEITDKPVCFLADAPVLTTNGYVRIDSIRVGDSVMTANGSFKVSKVFCETYLPGPDANPYVIPNGRFGAVGDLRISPRHRVSIDGRMVEARHLCLEQDNCESPITYYNLEIGGGNMIVAGVEVESLIPLSTYRIPGELFETVLKMKYGGVLTAEMKCEFHEDGSVSVPIV